MSEADKSRTNLKTSTEPFLAHPQENSEKSQKFAIAGAFTGVVIFSLVCTYAVTRPCVIGKCYAIPQTKESTQIAFTRAQISASDEDILAAQQQLNEAIATLQTIPSWSNYRSQAEKLDENYQKQSNYLNSLVSAIQLEQKAASETKTDKKQNYWQTAIATLKQIPPESQWGAIAQIKIQRYQNNLAGLERQQEEQQYAIRTLKTAQETAKLAKLREDNAQSLADWQLVSATWQKAVRQLQTISFQTTEYQQAKQLLEIYIPRSIAAQTHQQREEFAVNISQKATQKAKIAQNEEQQNKWLTAASHWRDAIALIQQIPQNTFQYRQIEPLIVTYTLALTRATEFAEVDRSLEKICFAQSQICDYAIADKVIKINLTSNYLQKLWETVIQARTTGNWQTEAQVRDRIDILEKNLQSLSNNSGKRVEVYNSDKRLMKVYEVNRL